MRQIAFEHSHQLLNWSFEFIHGPHRSPAPLLYRFHLLLGMLQSPLGHFKRLLFLHAARGRIAHFFERARLRQLVFCAPQRIGTTPAFSAQCAGRSPVIHSSARRDSISKSASACRTSTANVASAARKSFSASMFVTCAVDMGVQMSLGRCKWMRMCRTKVRATTLRHRCCKYSSIRSAFRSKNGTY